MAGVPEEEHEQDGEEEESHGCLEGGQHPVPLVLLLVVVFLKHKQSFKKERKK